MNKMSKPQSCKIAVIGLGCIYPGAVSPLQLWENILARRRQFREMPDVRLPNGEYYDPDPAVPNKTYQNKAALIDGYSFNWLEKRIPKQTFESTDIVHWLALDTALQAISDAGFDKNGIPKEKTGVILGNTLTGEFTRSNQMLLRWPYVKKVFRESARKNGLDNTAELEATMEELYKSVFYPVTEDTLAGGLANTIAGRVCNYLDLHGGGYIVDGACSSSLLALVTAANYLELHQMDLAIAGGVDISLDTFELIGFAKTGALTPDEMRVYDKNGKGFLPGEGCGMVVLKRYEDAVKDQNEIYAVVDGWGISSDGKGGITAPSVAGQARALIRAREKAGLNADMISFVEGHGTGTTVGDKVELEAIANALNHNGEIPARNCGVTSFKSIVGHTKAAAGIGAFIKTVMSVNRRVLPPTAGLKDPNPIFEDKGRWIYPLVHGKVHHHEEILYAGVSAMGFGGINSHVILHSGDRPSEKLRTAIDEKYLVASYQTHELFLFAASDQTELIFSLRNIAEKASGISYAEMTDLAFMLSSGINPNDRMRAAIVADTPFELLRKISVVIDKLNNWNGDGMIRMENDTISAGYKKDNLRIGAVFPGQGSQKINMARRLKERFTRTPQITETAISQFLKEEAGDVLSYIFKDTERATGKDEISAWQSQLKQTNIAQPAITLASLLWHEYLTNLGISFHAVAGHSLGELMSFYAAGRLHQESLLRFSAFRGKSMASKGSGTMASLQCPANEAERIVSMVKGYVAIANINGPLQTVISGETETIHEIVQLAKDNQIGAVELPVSAAFHSRLVAEVANDIEAFSALKQENAPGNKVKLISSVTGCEISGSINLNKYFAEQAVSRVDFISTINALCSHCDIILEVGPGRVLSGLVANINGSIPVFPVEPAADDDFSFNILIGNVFVAGCDLNTTELYNNRLVRPFTPAGEKKFLVNPLERPFPDLQVGQPAQISLLSGLYSTDRGSEFNSYFTERSSFIREIIDTDFRYFKKNQPSKSKEETIPAEAENVRKIVAGDHSLEEAGSNDDIEKLLRQKVQDMTGFDQNSFNAGMKLLDDFNLDSIKAATLINGLARTLGVQGKINASTLSNATLGEISDSFKKITGTDTVRDPQKVRKVSDKSSGLDIENEIYEELSKRTGFPREALSSDHKLLDDLNLDSIKAGAFISQMFRKFNVQKKNSSAGFSNASIGDIIKAIGSALPEESNANSEKTFSTSWINTYSVELVTEPAIVGSARFDDFWKDRTLVIVHSEEQTQKVTEIKQKSGNAIARIITVPYGNLKMLSSFEKCCILVLVANHHEGEEGIWNTVKMLTTVCSRLDETDMLGFLQFNDGIFSRNKDAAEMSFISVASFAASLHLEHPEMKIRVVETHRNNPVEQGIQQLMDEFIIGGSFGLAGYDSAGIRRIMQYGIRKHNPLGEETTRLNETDVVIATGGAKGITAECVFAFAKKYRCKTALVGSSALSSEIESTISRYKSENLIARYYRCDISNIAELRETTGKINGDLGKITAVIHGAGKNIPRKADKVSFEDAMDEIAPKLKGYLNLKETLTDHELKCFIALTSIIGITGMPGNSWYAFSNENLDLKLRAAAKNSVMKTRTIAYSIWDEIGMGARMGSNRVLSDMGIGSIKPSAGIDEFMYWISRENDDQQIVVSSKLGGLDTWKPALPEIKANRFITDIKSYEPGREVSVRIKLSALSDIYLNDHNYQGSLLFPTVFGIEAMAQTACLLSGITDPASMIIENISLRRPVVVPPEGDIEIGLSAKVIESDQLNGDGMRIFAGIATEDSDYSVFHFSADFTIRRQTEEIPHKTILPDAPLNIHAVTDLYSWLLFQGPGFQNIGKVYKLENDQTILTVEPSVAEPEILSYSDKVRTPLIAGNPLMRDILLQSVQLFLTKNKYLPVGIKRWEIFDIGRQGKGGIVISKLNELRENSAICDVDYISENRLIERITGYEVKALESTEQYPSAQSLSEMQNLFNDALNKEFFRFKNLLHGKAFYKLYKHPEEFNTLKVNRRHEIEQQVFQSVIEHIPGIEDNSRILWGPNGKPSIANSQFKISIAHSRNILIMTVGSEEQGCDIEFVNSVSIKDWENLFENKYSEAISQTADIDKDTDTAYTRLWCVRESLIKSFGQIPLSISIEKVLEKGIVFKAMNANGDYKQILTFPVKFLPSNTAIVAMLVDLEKDEISVDTGSKPRYATLFHEETRQFSDNFYTTFRDCRGFSGKTHFTSFIDWMGGLRELVLKPISKELMKDLGSGEFGMVTNTSEILIRHEAGTLDEITGNLWITGQSDLPNSFIDLNFAFYKNSDQKKILLADCKLSTTWVRIEGRGIVKKSPIPDYFLDFLNSHIQHNGNKKTNHIRNGFPVAEDIGKIIYRDGNSMRPEYIIHEHLFSTGLSHGNTVGNLYYSNYYNWQSRMIEDFLFMHVPEIMTGGGKKGEFITLHSTVKHLQEAMPFESVAVKMYISEILTNGLKFYFEYYCTDKTSKRKLAYGSNTIIFCRRDDGKDQPLVALLPGKLVSELQNKIHNSI